MALPPRVAVLAVVAVVGLCAAPLVHAGAVFEIREQVPSTDAAYKFQFTQKTVIPGAGSIVGSQDAGAGLVFKSSAIPLTRITLNRCAAVAPHIHPNAAETLIVMDGAVRITQFRGEEDGAAVCVTELQKGEAGYIQQGSIHTVENISGGTTELLVLFDHPQGGTVFATAALLALPRNVVNSAFSSPVLSSTGITAAPFFLVKGCGNVKY